jgi:hypothetical protein
MTNLQPGTFTTATLLEANKFSNAQDAFNFLADHLADEFAALQDLADEAADQFANRTPETPGAFLTNGTYYRVQLNRTTGRPYAKVLTNGSWEYVMGAIYKVREIDRLSLEQAKVISAQIGECVICGRTLTDGKSVDAGIGPVCRKRVA